jgi:hypothetical protein
MRRWCSYCVEWVWSRDRMRVVSRRDFAFTLFGASVHRVMSDVMLVIVEPW